MKITSEQWDKAKEDFDSTMKWYTDNLLTPGVETAFALAITFKPLLARYESGERTDDLYESMISVE